ncbi:terpenoid cyclases/Protein prenyltransferase [Lizonia empirigonia]|nr:terpenoid cyclases/Protein prenyltransferase [Lizonia empirigonia]
MTVPLRSSTQLPSASERLEEIFSGEDRIEELSDSELGSEDEYEDMGAATLEEQANIAYLESVRIPIKEDLQTSTSKTQDETLKVVLPFLEGNPNDFPLNLHGIPTLQRKKHVTYLEDALDDYPAGFAMMDASRPWIIYWALQGLTALGEDVSEHQRRTAHSFSLAQHPEGGFGGGYGQMPHLACSYAATLSLATAGGTATYDSINRKTMWHFLGHMKQADGGFTMCQGGEEDIRGAFCAMVLLSLLNLPLELPNDSPARKQGLATFTDNLGDWVSKCQSWDGGISAAPGNEAHEGGYNGRTNKLVDGCYSHWVGGCWSLIEAATTTGLWNRTALGRYILAAAQDKRGGLRDKPGKRSDAYHTCYNLAGLSAAQHHYVYDEGINKGLGEIGLGAPFRWKAGGMDWKDIVWDASDVVGKIHPVFVIPFRAVYECRKYFEDKERF